MYSRWTNRSCARIAVWNNWTLQLKYAPRFVLKTARFTCSSSDASSFFPGLLGQRRQLLLFLLLLSLCNLLFQLSSHFNSFPSLTEISNKQIILNTMRCVSVIFKVHNGNKIMIIKKSYCLQYVVLFTTKRSIAPMVKVNGQSSIKL